MEVGRSNYRFVIVDCDDRIHDSPRCAVARQVLGDADAVAVGMGASPIGVTRTVDWVGALRSFSDVTLHIAISRHVGRRSWAEELGRAVTRNVKAESVTSIRQDRQVMQASWNRKVILTGRAAKAYSRLAAKIATGPTANQ